MEELVGEDVRQHKKTQILIGVVISMLALLLTMSILATAIATKANQSLRSKLMLVESVMPFFNLPKTDSDPNRVLIDSEKEEAYGKKHPFERLWSSLKATFAWLTEMEKWIDSY